MKKLCIIAFIALIFGCSEQKSDQNDQKIAEVENDSPKIENFALELATGERIELEKSMSEVKITNPKQAILLNFVTSECLPCAAQNYNFAKIAQKYEKIKIIEIATGIESKNDAVALKEQNKLGFEVAFGDTTKLINAIKMAGYPYSVLFDSRGKVVQSYDGLVPPEMLEYDIQRAK